MKYDVTCGGCLEQFVASDRDERERCPQCGTEHSAPWEDPAVVSSPLPEPKIDTGSTTRSHPLAEEPGDQEVNNGGSEITLSIDVDDTA